MTRLAEYRLRRDFKKTPEPRGWNRKRRGAPGLRFVIQEHHARRLHFDFRLELGGSLKSWAVPKGPPTAPGERRLAVHVEDHPLEYGVFEGVIPKGEYGAGTVRIWDQGTWAPKGEPFSAYERGKLEFHLDGGRLKGDWVLVEMHGSAGENGKNWLLIKERDTAETAATPRVSEGRKAPMPEFIEPELATLTRRAPPGAEWIHEVKFDGYRILARIDNGAVRLFSRNGKDWTSRFATIAASLKRLRARQAWIDGEIVVLDEKGRSDFQSLQNALSGAAKAKPVYYAFDLLYADGRDLRDSPLLSRKTALAVLIGKNATGALRYTDHIDGRGPEFFREACRMTLEGVVSKRRDAPYQSGRSLRWMKVKCLQEQEFVIGGYTAPKASRSGFGALLLGVYGRRHELKYCGRVGTGFSARSLADIHKRLRKLERPGSPFHAPPPDSKQVHWVEPRLVAEVSFSEWTKEGILRQPSFHGLREDKPAPIVKREKPVTPSATKSAAPPVLGDVVVGVRITHPDRVLYPGLGVTKIELARFYQKIADRILPYVTGRPLAIVRCPAGISQGKECFFQKHIDESFPEAVKSVEIEEKGEKSSCLYIEDAAGLVGLVQMGALELHPWGSRIETIEKPDCMIFDLDPADDSPWENVVIAARELRSVLLELKLASFLKTTGGKGLHVVVPLAPDAVWDQVKEFSRQVALTLVGEHPKLYTANLSKSARHGKVFIDYLRNGRGATAVAPYSTRAKPGAPVATPIDWEELSPRLKPDQFNVANLARRLMKRDPWSRYGQILQSISGRHFLKIGNV